MENNSVIDPRLLVEAISKAMLSHDGSVDNHERYQELAQYLRKNAYEIAMNVIYSQPPPDAPQGRQVSTQTMRSAATNANRRYV